MNRHCPQCQNDQATKWLRKERKRLLDTRYFLLTFTMPKELRNFARAHQKLFYHLLFSESWRAMQKLARNPKWLGGKTCPERSPRNDRVTFLYKHPETKRWTPMTLPVFEFIRRFLQRMLPRGFKKVRHFGFLASRNKQLLALLHYMLGTVELEPEDEPEAKAKIPCCPVCGKPVMLIEIVPPGGFDARPEISFPPQRHTSAP